MDQYWIDVSFIPSNKARTAYYTWLKGFPRTTEEISGAEGAVETKQVVGVLIQHAYVDGMPNPVKSRVVPAVFYNGGEYLMPASEMANDGETTFVGIWADGAEYPQEEIDASISVRRRFMLDKLKRVS